MLPECTLFVMSGAYMTRRYGRIGHLATRRSFQTYTSYLVAISPMGLRRWVCAGKWGYDPRVCCYCRDLPLLPSLLPAPIFPEPPSTCPTTLPVLVWAVAVAICPQFTTTHFLCAQCTALAFMAVDWDICHHMFPISLGCPSGTEPQT